MGIKNAVCDRIEQMTKILLGIKQFPGNWYYFK